MMIKEQRNNNRECETEVISVNCRKGYITKSKNEQIKIIAEENNPKVMFIQEAEIPKASFNDLKPMLEIAGYKRMVWT